MVSKAVDRTLRDLKGSGDPLARARYLSEMAEIEAFEGRKAEACRLYLEALARFRSKRRHDSPMLEASVACSLFNLGYREQGLEILDKMGDADLRQIVFADLIADFAKAGDISQALELLSELRDPKLRAEVVAGICRQAGGNAAGDIGPFLDELEAGAAGLEPGSRIGLLCLLAEARHHLGQDRQASDLLAKGRAELETVTGLKSSWQAADNLAKAHIVLGLNDKAKELVTDLLKRMVAAKLVCEQEEKGETGLLRGALYSAFVRVAVRLAGIGEDDLVEGMITFLEGEEHRNIGLLYIGKEYARAGYLERAGDMANMLSGVQQEILKTRITSRLITDGRKEEARRLLARTIKAAIKNKSSVVLRDAALELHRLNPKGDSARNLMKKAHQLAKRSRKPRYQAHLWPKYFAEIGDFPLAMILAYKVDDLEMRLDMLKELRETAAEYERRRGPRAWRRYAVKGPETPEPDQPPR
jgi:tetratricopeptide (TPR) repeat protein